MSKEPTFFAYMHARPNTEDIHGVFYVGKGKRDRHKDFSHRTPYHKNVVAKYGAENILIGKYECSNEAVAMELEKGLIKCLKRAGVSLTNFTDGGEGLSGHKHTEETKAKMRAARLGWCPSVETREKLRQHNIGKPGTFTGKKHTEEAKAKIAAAKKGKPNLSARRPKTEDEKSKISATKMAAPFVNCPHCNFYGRYGSAMKRYHFSNCKKKNS